MRRVRAALGDAPVDAVGRAWPVTARIGTAVWSAEYGGLEDLLAAADQAMYAVKGAGRDGIVSQ